MFTSYLSNRQQLTKIDESVSVLDIIEWGVPQGSVLGPLLFLIFINDIPLASDLGNWLFADDTVLVESAGSLHRHWMCLPIAKKIFKLMFFSVH